jgi:hypothetical protein
VIAAAVVLIARVVAGVPPPTDPFPPVDQDPDDIRIEACKLVTADPSKCSAPRTTLPRPPDTPSGGGADLSFLSLMLWILLAAAVIAVIVLIARRGVSGQASKRSTHGDGDDDDDDEVIEEGAVFVDRSREPGDWRSQADEHRRAGRHREALRCRYRALVGDLARRGWIDEIGRTTGGTVARCTRSRPRVLRSAAAELFDGAWYGHFDVSEATTIVSRTRADRARLRGAAT